MLNKKLITRDAILMSMSLSRTLPIVVGYLLQLGLCLLCIFFMYSIFSLDRPEDTAVYVNQPLSFIYIFGTFSLFSIAFWHIFLARLIFVKTKFAYRSVVLRSFDYAWYAASFIAATLVINDIQLDTLSHRKDALQTIEIHDLTRPNQVQEILTRSCSSIDALFKKDDSILFYISKDNLDRICAAKLGSNEGDAETVKFCDEDQIYPLGSELRFFAPDHEKDLVDSLNNVALVCNETKRAVLRRKEIQDIDAAIGRSTQLPRQRSGRWLYILALVIGLRLTRTTADFVDALREARKAHGA